MVIGNGMLAKRFDSYRQQDDYIIFASGVSDSTNTGKAAFEREKKLLAATLQQYPARHLVYFGTCSIYDPGMQHTAYVQHKKEMEEIISASAKAYTIFRLSNPVGHTNNPHTLINYFIQHIVKQEPFSVWRHAARNIIDIDDMYTICDYLLGNGQFTSPVINIANPQNYPVPYIVECIEKHFGIRGHYHLVEKGQQPVIDTAAIAPLFRKFNINFGEDYLPNLLQKYFPRS